MQIITSLDELVTLKDQIRAANRDVILEPKFTLFGSASKVKADALANNMSLYERLPARIEVSPEIAKFMLKSISDYDEQKAAIDSKDPYFKSVVKAVVTGVGAAVFPTPHHIIQAGNVARKAFKAIDGHEKNWMNWIKPEIPQQ